jgi:hypothetical protein
MKCGKAPLQFAPLAVLSCPALRHILWTLSRHRPDRTVAKATLHSGPSLRKRPKVAGTADAELGGMDNNINKASVSLLAMATLVIAAIAAKVRATIEAQAPLGYEDESGFHYEKSSLVK